MTTNALFNIFIYAYLSVFGNRGRKWIPQGKPTIWLPSDCNVTLATFDTPTVKAYIKQGVKHVGCLKHGAVYTGTVDNHKVLTIIKDGIRYTFHQKDYQLISFIQ
jgi:hypothetical protein